MNFSLESFDEADIFNKFIQSYLNDIPDKKQFRLTELILIFLILIFILSKYIYKLIK